MIALNICIRTTESTVYGKYSVLSKVIHECPYKYGEGRHDYKLNVG